MSKIIQVNAMQRVVSKLFNIRLAVQSRHCVQFQRWVRCYPELIPCHHQLRQHHKLMKLPLVLDSIPLVSQVYFCNQQHKRTQLGQFLGARKNMIKAFFLLKNVIFKRTWNRIKVFYSKCYHAFDYIKNNTTEAFK